MAKERKALNMRLQARHDTEWGNNYGQTIESGLDESLTHYERAGWRVEYIFVQTTNKHSTSNYYDVMLVRRNGWLARLLRHLHGID